MTKKERVSAVLEGREPDHTPCGFSLHFPEAEKQGEAAVQAHLRFFRETDTDILKVMNENLVPNLGEIRRPADWNCLHALKPDAEFLKRQLEMTLRIRDRWDGGEAFWMGTLHGITASAIHPIEAVYGYDGVRTLLIGHLREDPAPVLDAMKRIAECMCALAHGYRDAGMDAVYYAALGGERDRWFTDEEFARWIEPFDRLILSEIQKAGCSAFLHICKDGLNMERYRAYHDVCDAVNWGVYEAPYSLEDGRALFSGKVLMGGLKNRSGVLVEGTEEEIAAEAGRLAGQYGPKKFILGADCTLPTEIDTRRIRTAADALKA